VSGGGPADPVALAGPEGRLLYRVELVRQPTARGRAGRVLLEHPIDRAGRRGLVMSLRSSWPSPGR